MDCVSANDVVGGIECVNGLLDVIGSVAVGGLLVTVGLADRVDAWEDVAGRVRVVETSAVFVGFIVGVMISGFSGANIMAHTESAAILLPHGGATLIGTS